MLKETQRISYLNIYFPQNRHYALLVLPAFCLSDPEVIKVVQKDLTDLSWKDLNFAELHDLSLVLS